jgi:hypothetical protein
MSTASGEPKSSDVTELGGGGARSAVLLDGVEVGDVRASPTSVDILREAALLGTSELRAELESARASIAEADDIVARLRAESRALNGQLSETTKKAEQWLAQLVAVRGDLAAVRADLSGATKEAEQLRAQLAASRSAEDSMRVDLSRQLSDATKAADQLRTELAAARSGAVGAESGDVDDDATPACDTPPFTLDGRYVPQGARPWLAVRDGVGRMQRSYDTHGNCTCVIKLERDERVAKFQVEVSLALSKPDAPVVKLLAHHVPSSAGQPHALVYEGLSHDLRDAFGEPGNEKRPDEICDHEVQRWVIRQVRTNARTCYSNFAHACV